MAGLGVIESLTNPQVLVSEGVPAILGLTSGATATAAQFAALATATAQGSALSAVQEVYDTLTGTEWGLFKNKKSTSSSSIVTALENAVGLGTSLSLFPDSLVFEVGFSSPTNIAQARIEGGSFVSYNKTLGPRQIRIGMSFSGSSRSKADQLSRLDNLRKSTTLVSVRMPSYSFQNMNIVDVMGDRSAQQGADLLVVNVILQEARIEAQTVIVQTKNGTTASEVDTGSKQTQTPTSAQANAIGAS